MRSIRVYSSQKLANKKSHIFDGVEFHHIKNVLKAKENQKVITFDNSGYVYEAVISKIFKKKCEIEILDASYQEPNKNFTEIAFSICKNPCSDLLIQKTTELGVSSIQPLITKNSIYNINKKSFHNKLEHWKKISINAAEQSERIYLPEIQEIKDLETYLKECNSSNKLVLDTKSNDMISKYKFSQKNLSTSILVGPEGDFTEDEYKAAKNLNFLSVSLGKNILRVETAALSALSFIKLIEDQ